MIPPFPGSRRQTAADTQLASLGGRPPPRDLVADLLKISALPEAARERFWEILAPCLGASNPPDLAAQVKQFCAAHGASPDVLGDAVGAARHLVRAAALRGLSRATFEADLGRIPGDHDLAAVLLPGFDAGKQLVQQEVTRGSLTDHGKQLTGVDWRLDAALASQRGSLSGTPVITLTLRYDEGGERSRVTLQTTMEGLRELSDACAAIFEQAGESGARR